MNTSKILLNRLTTYIIISHPLRFSVHIRKVILNNNTLLISSSSSLPIQLFSTNIINKMTQKYNKEELKKRLTPLQYHVTQEAGTERPYSGCYDKTFDKGTYVCIVCEQALFNSDTKFDSGCGWPAFNQVLDEGKVKLLKDTSLVGSNLLLLVKHPERIRTEVRCSECNAHMGHVFDDGPLPTRKRFCINSASIHFVPANTTTTTAAAASDDDPANNQQ